MYPPPTFSLCYATRRPDCIRPKIEEWRIRATGEDNIEVFLCVDAEDDDSLAVASGVKDVLLLSQPDKPYTCVKAWNLAALQAKGDIIIAVDDDHEPPPAWDYLLEFCAKGEWWKEPRVVLVDDIISNGTLATLPIITKAWHDKVGYLLNPEYESMYMDTELTHHSKLLGMRIDAIELKFPHKHHTRGDRPKDDVDEKHSSAARVEQGRLVFERRLAQGFPLAARL